MRMATNLSRRLYHIYPSCESRALKQQKYPIAGARELKSKPILDEILLFFGTVG